MNCVLYCHRARDGLAHSMTSFWEIAWAEGFALLEPHWDAAQMREDDIQLQRYWPYDYQALAEPFLRTNPSFGQVELNVDKWPDDLDLPDIPDFWGGTLTLAPKAHASLNSIIGGAGELTKISTRFGMFWMFAPFTILDCLVREQSEARYFSTGAIRENSALTFSAQPDAPPIFRIRESATSLFATNAFVAAVHQSGLTGLEFVPVRTLS